MPRRVLAPWFLDVIFKPFSRATVISEVDAVISGVQNCQMAGLVPAFWQLGTLGAPGGILGLYRATKNRRLLFFYVSCIFNRIL